MYCVEWETCFEFCPKFDRHIIRKARVQQYLRPHSVVAFIETIAMLLYETFHSGTNRILHFMENIAMFLYITFKLIQLKCL